MVNNFSFLLEFPGHVVTQIAFYAPFVAVPFKSFDYKLNVYSFLISSHFAQFVSNESFPPPDYETSFAPLNVEIEAGGGFDDRYAMHEEVGKGRFGIVYRVSEKTSGVKRAAKVIKCIKAKDKEKVSWADGRNVLYIKWMI